MTQELDERLVLASLIGDALALGPHWEYDPSAIAEKLGDCDRYHAPIRDYHPGKTAGDHTHYGDQARLLAQHLYEAGEWDAADFKARWVEYWESSESYRDHATLDTLKTGRASSSNELGGAARLAPLLAFLAGCPIEERVAAAREQTAITHDNPIALDAAEFVTRVSDALLNGSTFLEAAKTASTEGRYTELRPADLLHQIEAQAANDAIDAIGELGRACPTPQALPSALFIALKHGENPAEALAINARAGGDSAARGLVLGLWLGARHGTDWIPAEWREGLTSRL